MLVEATIAVSDSTQHAGHEENVGQAIIAHVSNSSEWHLPFLHLHLPHFPPVNLFGIEIDLSISNHVIMMWIASLLLLFIFTQLYDRRRKVPSGITALLETLILFCPRRDSHTKYGPRNRTTSDAADSQLFFFILTMNLMGLIPCLPPQRQIYR
jgi:F-type H+-transporting ATPase subunit a